MLTLRFENDSISSDDSTFIVEAPHFRTKRQNDGSIDVLIDDENGWPIAHPVASGIGAYDRCYVMNAHGKTIAKFEPDLMVSGLAGCAAVGRDGYEAPTENGVSVV